MIRVLSGIILLLAAACGASAQLKNEDFRSILVKDAGFTDDDFQKLSSGAAVVKLVSQKNKQEIAVVGVIRVASGGPFPLTVFRDSLAQGSGKSMSSGGLFSDPPKIDDLAGLELEDRDYKELAKCKVRDCDLNLSAEAIVRLQKTLSSAAADARPGASDKFVRDLLFGYVTAYLQIGDASLRPYANKKDEFDAGASLRSMIGDSILIGDIAPSLAAFVRDFPKSRPDGVESEIRWSHIDFGLNPALVLTHTIAFSQPSGKSFHQIVVNKQFYGTRYLDASLSIAFLLSIAEPEGVRYYIVFTDRSTTDAIDGPFGSVTRRLVANEAVERTTDILERSELKLIAPPSDAPESTTDPAGNSPVSRWLVIGAVAVAAAVVLWFLLGRRTGSKH